MYIYLYLFIFIYIYSYLFIFTHIHLFLLTFIYFLLRYCVVGSGAAEGNMRLPPQGYVEKIWDHAPGGHFIIEAGGEVTDLEGRQLDFSRGRMLDPSVTGIIASNGVMHKVNSGGRNGERNGVNVLVCVCVCECECRRVLLLFMRLLYCSRVFSFSFFSFLTSSFPPLFALFFPSHFFFSSLTFPSFLHFPSLVFSSLLRLC